LGQFHLKRALARVRVLGEDVQDQRSSVQNLDIIAEGLLQFALVARRELVIKNHHVGPQVLHEGPHLLHLAGADQRGRIDLLNALIGLTDDLQAGSAGQLGQLGQRILHREQVSVPFDLNTYQKRTGSFGLCGLNQSCDGNSPLHAPLLRFT